LAPCRRSPDRLDKWASFHKYVSSGGVLRAPGFMTTEAKQLLLEHPHVAMGANVIPIA
jgi:hypothetical protein